MEKVFLARPPRVDASSGVEKERRQPVETHCRTVADLASARLQAIGLSRSAYLAGLVHDCGKYTDKFAAYIAKAAAGEKTVRGSVNHTFAGVRLLLERFHGPQCITVRDWTSEILAYSAGAHHGLFDCLNEERRYGFLHRLEKEDIGYDEALANFLRCCANEKELEERFNGAAEEMAELFKRIGSLCSGDAKGQQDCCFYLALTARMILSAVIDGDRSDAAAFDRGSAAEPVKRAPWKKVLETVEKKLDDMKAEEDLNRARREISQRCRAFAEEDSGGLVRLNVPTGAGKTLASLRYALALAAKEDRPRILFVSPLLTIIDQNAAVLRKYIGDDELILEHHSNVTRERQQKGQEGKSELAKEQKEELDRAELAAENWDSPIVITTMVQLLNTLFAGDTSCVRRFQSLCRSVIVIDEAQALPVRMLSAFNLTLNFLTQICGATVVLCSATQPCLEAAKRPLCKVPQDMVPNDPQLWKAFQRTRLEVADGGRPMDQREIAGLAGKILGEAQSLLVVCNTRRYAEGLFKALEDFQGERFFLSAALCPAHRRAVLEKLKEALASHRPTLCVSTQVIESGVDISFERAIRLCAGMDSVVQTAGRCNRNGEAPEPAPVLLLRAADEQLGPLKDIKVAQAATGELLERAWVSEEIADLTSDAAIAYYYRRLYANAGPDVQDDPVESLHSSIFQLLADNRGFYDPADDQRWKRFGLKQAFKTAGEQFHVFDSPTRSVLIPYGAGKTIITELNSRQDWDTKGLREKLREAQLYCVSLFDNQIRGLMKRGGLFEFSMESFRSGTIEPILVLADHFYDPVTGVSMEPTELPLLEIGDGAL